MAKFNSQDFANTSHALASLGHCHVNFAQAWLQHVDGSVISEFNAQDLSNSCWSLAVWHAMAPDAERSALGAAVDEAAAALLRRLRCIHDADPDGFALADYLQAFQAFEVLHCGAALREQQPALARCCETKFVAQTCLRRKKSLNAMKATDWQQLVLDAAVGTTAIYRHKARGTHR